MRQIDVENKEDQGNGTTLAKGSRTSLTSQQGRADVTTGIGSYREPELINGCINPVSNSLIFLVDKVTTQLTGPSVMI